MAAPIDVDTAITTEIMPPKESDTKCPKASSTVCAVCTAEIENTDDVLRCWSCDQSFHRYCAGAALTEYKLHENGSPYQCLHCYKANQDSLVAGLKVCIESFTAEVMALRSTVQELSAKPESPRNHSVSTQSQWSIVTRSDQEKAREKTGEKG